MQPVTKTWAMMATVISLSLSCASSIEQKQLQRGMFFSGIERLAWPLDGRLTSVYGKRRWRQHHGIDIASPRGNFIYAAAAGRVVKAGWQRGYGKTLVLRHRHLQTLYAHCMRLLVKPGEWVKRGQAIALVGATGRATGPHLHFEVRTKAGKPLNPLDHLPLRRREYAQANAG